MHRRDEVAAPTFGPWLLCLGVMLISQVPNALAAVDWPQLKFPPIGSPVATPAERNDSIASRYLEGPAVGAKPATLARGS